MNIQDIEKAAARASFAGFMYASKGSGEIAIHNIILGASVAAAYKRDIRLLEKLRDDMDGIELQACDELIASMKESLEKGVGNNSRYTKQGYYVQLGRGLKFAPETGQLYIKGYAVKKTVVRHGEFKAVKSSQKTIAKNKLRRKLRSGRIREFILDINQIAGIKCNGKLIEFESNKGNE